MPARRKPAARPREKGHLHLAAFLVLLFGWGMTVFPGMADDGTLSVSLSAALPLGLIAGAFLLVHLVLRFARYAGDPSLPPLVFLLAGIGFLFQIRLGTVDLAGTAMRPSLYAWPLGLGAFLGAWLVFRKDRHVGLHRLALPCYVLAVAVLGAMVLFGRRYRGGVFLAGQFNPTEIVKPLLAVFIAGRLTDVRRPLAQTFAGLPAPPRSTALPLIALWAVPIGLLLVLRDLGMVMLLNTVLLLLVFVVTGARGYLVAGIAGAGLAFAGGFHFFPHARARMMVWLNPFEDPTGSGWQILQSLSAMFSGGLFGRGWGAGAPGAVPIAASDFVYAILAEEIGLVGCLLVVLVYLLVIRAGYGIADRQRHPFNRALAGVLVTFLAVQAFMNIAGVTKAIPLTGITLPLISQGGSSLVVSLFMLGLLAALSDSGRSAPVRGRKPARASAPRRRAKAGSARAGSSGTRTVRAGKPARGRPSRGRRGR